jgi:general secretion pathway protein A
MPATTIEARQAAASQFEAITMAYERFWGLQARPFDNVPDPRFYFPSVKHETARQRMLHGIEARKGALLLTGAIGSGKTLLSRALVLALHPSRYDMAVVTNPALPAVEFLAEIAYQFGLDPQGNKLDLVHRLHDRCLLNHHQCSATVLVIDEAQSIAEDRLFEELRLLLNFQLNHQFLLTLLLMGQPELVDRVRGIPQLNQRIALRCQLLPFDEEETRAYVRARLHAAGASRDIFSKEAQSEIHRQSGGVCRVINSICDLCLLLGSLDEVDLITPPVVEQALRVL